MSQTWQIIPDFRASGAVHMALDALLLEQHLQGDCPPTLRFYGWEPAAISLGYHQRRWPEHWAELDWQGEAIELVRRPSGGRAVLHQGDLTYAVIASAAAGFGGKRAAVYRQVCEFLRVGWRSLGVPLTYGSAGRGYIHNPNCFGTATAADLVMENGAKLIGSAQLWRSGGLLQHGSMRLATDPELLKTVFETEENLPHLPASLRGEPGRLKIIDALTRAAADCWDVKFETRELSEEDWAGVGDRLVV